MAKIAILWSDFGSYHFARLRALVEAGVDVVGIGIFSQSGSDWFGSSVPAGLHAHVHLLGLERDVRARALYRQLADSLDSIRPDFVFVPGWSATEALCVIRWCTATGTPAVVMSDSHRIQGLASVAKAPLKRCLLNGAHSVFVAGTAARMLAIRYGVPSERIAMGYNAIDNSAFYREYDAILEQQLLLEWFGVEFARYIVCCARLIAEKNHVLLLQAYAEYRLALGRDSLPLVLVGDGPLESDLIRLVRELDLVESVIFAGGCAPSTIPTILGAAEGSVLPSISETWGLVVNESLASGTPVVLSNRCGSAGDLINHLENGYVFDAHDREDLVRGLTWVTRRRSQSDRTVRNQPLPPVNDWGLSRFVAGVQASIQIPRRDRRSQEALAGLVSTVLLRLRR